MTRFYATVEAYFITTILIGFAQLSYTPPAEIGVPSGLLPECPGVLKNASIRPKTMRRLQVISYQKSTHGVIKKVLPVTEAAKLVANDKNIDLKNKKTVLYAVGYLEWSDLPDSKNLASFYVNKGYNVFVTETHDFLNLIYPKSVRLAKVIGKKLGEFLVQLTKQGMNAKNLELLGISLGAHIAGYTAKHYYSVTGMKPTRITGLDPAGPCFRSLPPKYRLDASDGENVDIVHTNIDGFGIADRLGHVDFYVNGGEFQPGDLIFNPCLTICSHVKSFLYWWQALVNPKMFIGIRCNSIQDARVGNFKEDSETNFLGAETNFSRPGIYYLGTLNIFPYYRGEDGLKPENEIFKSGNKFINSDDILEV
ncbi:lipase member H-B-like [Plodia interpunctella]|uniref:lipase member H-B-like n=1 Tax=Plodia interpunctella TaxID=58824 RepID=UPI0023679692|nr:lipase member H-B-like [Plodia interpunctella]XP_053618479.1 lipase member H-B-like [Plodia interpunctella]